MSKNELPAIWKTVNAPSDTPNNRIRKLIDSPLKESVWESPLQFGPITIEAYWEERRAKYGGYSASWPQTPHHIANLLISAGLEKADIYRALSVEQSFGQETLRVRLQLHKLLLTRLGAKPTHKDALSYIQRSHELTSSDGGIRARKAQELLPMERAWIEPMRHIETFQTTLHTLTQYDNTPEAHVTYFNVIKQAIENETLQSYYQYGTQSTGMMVAQTFTEVNDTDMANWLYSKHDTHALAYMTVRGRLPFETFLKMMATPHTNPIPQFETRGYRSELSAEEQLKRQAQTALDLAFEHTSPESIHAGAMLYKAKHNIDALQSLVALPDESSSIRGWWEWNLKLHQAGLIDPSKPSPSLQAQLDLLKSRLENLASPQARSSDYFGFHLSAPQMNTSHAEFAKSNPILADTAWYLTMHSLSRNNKITENWESFKSGDWSWLPHAQCRNLIPADILKDRVGDYNSRTHRLAFAGVLLPQMNKKDQVSIAPLIAYAAGVNTIQSLAPSTLRSLWKEQFPDQFKATIPKHYTGDTYILYALTRHNADDLMETLSSLNLRNDKDTYVQCVQNWTRGALQVPDEPTFGESVEINALFEM